MDPSFPSQEKDIYLLDDPLAAVDADVASHLMEKCILGILGHRTRILCTHRTELLEKADLLVLMDDGKIIQTGKRHRCAVYNSVLSQELTVLYL